MSYDNASSDQPDVKRHYLEVRDGVDVDLTLRTYCRKTRFHSYVAADRAKTKKLQEYGIEDISFIEVKFRR